VWAILPVARIPQATSESGMSGNVADPARQRDGVTCETRGSRSKRSE
jgi:hypothetical protein